MSEWLNYVVDELQRQSEEIQLLKIQAMFPDAETIYMTEQEYDALPVKDDNTIYSIRKKESPPVKAGFPYHV